MRNEANIRNHANGRISIGQNSLAWRGKIHEIGQKDYLPVHLICVIVRTFAGNCKYIPFGIQVLQLSEPSPIRTEYLKLLRFIAWKLILYVGIEH